MMRFVAVLAAMVTAVPATAQDAELQTPLRPMPRPERAAPVGVPLLVARPQGADKTVLATTVVTTGQRDQLMLDDEAHASCLAALRLQGVVYKEVKAVVPDEDADCGILQPIEVSGIAPGVTLNPAAVIRCPTALALAEWVQDFVVPAAARLEGRGALTSIENGSGYICRRRDNQVEGTLSEHAFGNAFDVMGFRFEHGPPVTIGLDRAEGDLVQSFQDAVRASACLDFTTVLGPGSDASHDDHLHLDIIARPTGYRLCELERAPAESNVGVAPPTSD